jgi:hypothetical protein
LPSASNFEHAAGADTQHFERGGFSAAPFSSSVDERRTMDHPDMALRIDGDASRPGRGSSLFGSGFGQDASTGEGRDVAGARGSRRRNKHVQGAEAGSDRFWKESGERASPSASWVPPNDFSCGVVPP